MADKIKILPYTIRAQMEESTLLRNAGEWYESYATDNNIVLDAVDRAVSRFLKISARVKNLNGVADFELATPTDTPEEMRQKFEVYANSEQIALVETITRKMAEMDKPHDSDTSPNAVLELFEGED